VLSSVNDVNPFSRSPREGEREGRRGCGSVELVTVTRGSASASEAPPTRRERLHEATAQEIRDTARDHLRTIPPADLSLRAIARSMGMTAPALYRYYDSRDALLEALLVDAYHSLTEELQAARDAEPEGDVGRRLLAASLAYRAWALAHPHEFALVFGSPIPGFAPGDRADSPVSQAGARFGATFLELFALLDSQGLLRETAAAHLAPEVAGGLEAVAHACGVALSAGAVHSWLSGWARLHGLISLELFGHLAFTALPAEQLFRSELSLLSEQMGFAEPQLALTFRPQRRRQAL
jgi:AcrR family transcriptional regulator